MTRLRFAFSSILLLALAGSLHAVTYIVPPDRDLVMDADAIVIATGISSKSHRKADGRIVTTATLRVEKAISGDLAAGQQFDLTELGGEAGGLGLHIAGSPRYDAGKRYLIFVARNNHGERATLSMGLGRFAFVSDTEGHELLSRAVGDEPIVGIVEGTSAMHVERLRDAQKFIEFVGETARGKASTIDYDIDPGKHRVVVGQTTRLFPRANATRADYLLPGNPRWVTPTTTYLTNGAQPNFANGGRTAAQNATTMWNAGSGNTNLTLGATTTSTKGLEDFDEISSILFNDPTGYVARRRTESNNPNIAAVGGSWTSTEATHTLDGQTFFTILGVDIAVGTNLPISEAIFQAVITHEMGHTLGFRHSNECAAGQPCTTNAIMNAIVSVTTLQQWDLDAEATVYGTGTPQCTAASNVVASANVSSVASGGSVNLSVAHGGTGTFTYQWFTGSPGSGTAISGATTSTLSRTLTAPGTFYVAVTGCNTTVNSNAVSVAVTVPPGLCVPATQLCVNNARYAITLTATAPNGQTGQGVPFVQSNLFGYFSLPSFTNDAGNPEVFVKVVGPVNGIPWVFYAGLTNLDYTIRVVDTQTSQVFSAYRVPPPPAGSTQNIGDFDVAGIKSSLCSNVTITPGQTTAGGGCTSNSSSLCLLNRFRLTLDAKDNPTRTNNQGPGTAVPVNNVFGFFTTPTLSGDPNDIQAFVKMVDATTFTGTFWVFLGGLTDFEFTLTVTDTTNGKQKIYKKPAGSTCGLNDVAAF